MDEFHFLLVIKITISGTVQGVGFRPFVYRVAREMGLRGFVRNAGGVVEVGLAEHANQVQRFVEALRRNAPALAVIDRVDVNDAVMPDEAVEICRIDGFQILHSEARDVDFQTVPPDTATCDDCLREVDDSSDRRFGYPFTNCTNCGPRYTIITSLPYDRASTSMRNFAMCDSCAREFVDPLDRRFHAQPIACADCGPRIEFEPLGERGFSALELAVNLLKEGKILAVKGLGGFHLACEAFNQTAIAELRKRKQRDDKPFAVMFPDLEAVSELADFDEQEQALLVSSRRPIVLLREKKSSSRRLPRNLINGLDTIGAMLPYTPLHHLLLKAIGNPIVLTSANLSDEPICIDNQEARVRLQGIADGFLMHNRDIETRFDDSVLKVGAGGSFIRRSRGFAPEAIRISGQFRQEVVAFGAQLKNTFCFGKGDRAFMSQHIGDLDDVQSSEFFNNTFAKFQQLFRLAPTAVIHDAHPGYLSTRMANDFAKANGLPVVSVQHHHAHVVSCMIDNQLPADQPVLGIALDGTGYGDDGTVWGGEFLLSRFAEYDRIAHFEQVSMPGMEAAVRHPARMLLAYARRLPESFDGMKYIDDVLDRIFEPQQRAVIEKQLERNVNTCLTSSCGRLFDAVSALLGICPAPGFEGQAAMLLESAAYRAVDGHVEAIDLGLGTVSGAKLLGAVAQFQIHKASPEAAALYFHQILAGAVASVGLRLVRQFGLSRVCLSGGVFQNSLFTRLLRRELEARGLEVFVHKNVPTNDGGLSLGQLVAGSASLGWWEDS